MRNRKSYLPGFILYVLVLFFAFFDFQDYIVKEPQSIHHWRQSDGASIALNYYQHGMDFFQPEIHFQSADENSQGYGVGEFPILYYISAGLYQQFGVHSSIIRLLNTLLFFLGLFYLYKAVYQRFKSLFWALFIPTILAASPVIVYYSNNYLPNTSALAFVCIAWYHIGQYDIYKKNSSVWFSALFFTLAGLLKITALISFFPLLGLAILGLLPFKRWRYFQHSIQATIAYLSTILLNFLWYNWAIAYNDNHGTSYFSTHTWPYNSLSEEMISKVWYNIIHLWGDDYFYPATYIFLLILVAIFLRYLKRQAVFWIYLLGSLSIGFIAFGYLFFLNLMNHDYYTINLYIIPVLLMIAILDYYKQTNHSIFQSRKWKFALTIFVLFNLKYGKDQLEKRYTGWQNDMHLYTALDGIQPFLRAHDIAQEDKFLIAGDPTPNTALYRLNQQGWSDLYGNGDSVEKIQQLIDNKELQYLVVLNDRFLTERPYLNVYCSKVKAEYNGLKIYDLSSFKN